LPPALAVSSCGCFLPDLTRFTTLQCGEARQFIWSRAQLPRNPRKLKVAMIKESGRKIHVKASPTLREQLAHMENPS